MGKFKLILIIISIFLIQIVTYVFLNENGASDYLFNPDTVWLFLSLIILILYLVKRNTIKKAFQLSNVEFYTIISISWTLLCIISSFVLSSLLKADIIHGQCGGGFICLAGLEYVIVPFLYEFQLCVILALDLLWFIFKKVFNVEKNMNKEQTIRVIKKASTTIGILIAIVWLGYYTILGLKFLIYKNEINKISKEAEIEFNYNDYAVVYIDLDNYKASVVRNNGSALIIHNINELTYDKIQEDYINLLNYEGMTEVYSGDGITCYILKHDRTDDAILISINESQYYIIYDDGEYIF
ncbi:MAG: hypothetical protein PHT75_04900 [Bacilli bacterium]|nr:hypothetical protein [Bacilli bacterium]MDD3305428.1 hypothetical protein [Bacilli bacterium]MDD4054110.1 hypothetical protein [Bacilli bacterium]MDD4411895.1 hypothetical protein [Bacilli bacterium]